MMGRGDAPRVPGLVITGEHAELDIVQGELVVRHRHAGRRARVSLRLGNGSGVRRKIWDGRERRGDGRGGDGGHEPANPAGCWSLGTSRHLPPCRSILSPDTTTYHGRRRASGRRRARRHPSPRASEERDSSRRTNARGWDEARARLYRRIGVGECVWTRIRWLDIGSVVRSRLGSSRHSLCGDVGPVTSPTGRKKREWWTRRDRGVGMFSGCLLAFRRSQPV